MSLSFELTEYLLKKELFKAKGIHNKEDIEQGHAGQELRQMISKKGDTVGCWLLCGSRDMMDLQVRQPGLNPIRINIYY
jgi:hypothetical protein